MTSRLACICCIDKPLHALCRTAVREDGVDVPIIAGAPLAGLAWQVEQQISVPIFDGVSCAVSQADLLARLGSHAADTGSYAAPSSKFCQGLSPAPAALVGRVQIP